MDYLISKQKKKLLKYLDFCHPSPPLPLTFKNVRTKEEEKSFLRNVQTKALKKFGLGSTVPPPLKNAQT